MDLFSEIRRNRVIKNEDEVTIDGASGGDIPDAFVSVYRNIYNKARDDQKVEGILKKVNEMLGETDFLEVQKMNGFTVKEALSKIKSGKKDPIYEFSSDCLKNAPNIFHEYLASLIKAFPFKLK